MAATGQAFHLRFSSAAYLFNTSVAKNIAYGLKLRGNDVDTREQVVRVAIEWAGVHPEDGTIVSEPVKREH